MIALAGVIFLGAMAASTTADARMGGFGGGFRGGGFHGGGFRGGMSGFRSGFVGPRFASRPHFFRPGFARFQRFHHRPFFFARHRFHHRPFFFARHRFHHRRFAFAAVPFVVGASYYGDPCWRVRYTPWGPRRVYVCDGYY
jgi:hypothetical protein